MAKVKSKLVGMFPVGGNTEELSVILNVAIASGRTLMEILKELKEIKKVLKGGN